MTDPQREEQTTAGALRRALRWLAAATVVLYVILFAAGIKVYIDNQHTTDTLCTFRSDLETRVVGSILFLREHPEGLAGVPTKTIVDQITNQQRTITALQGLNCDSSTPEAVLQPLNDSGSPKQKGQVNPKRPRGHIPATRERELARRAGRIARQRGENPSQPTPSNPAPRSNPSPSPTPNQGPQGPTGPPGPQGPQGPSSTPAPIPPTPSVPETPDPGGVVPKIVDGVCSVAPIVLVC